jgi:hypothetical protein
MVIFNQAAGNANGPDNIPIGIFDHDAAGKGNQAAIRMFNII